MTARHLIFVHIPKTAGTSVRRNMKRAFERDAGPYTEIGVYDIPGDWVSTEAFAGHALPEDWDFLFGHVTVRQILANPGFDPRDAGITCLSFVRDPVDRCISVYNYIATTPSHRLHQACLDTPARDFFEMIARRDQDLQYRYLSCDREVNWRFLVAPSDRVGPTCAEAFRRVRRHGPGPAFFDKRFNVTRAFSEAGLARRIARDRIGRQEIAALYDLNPRDRKLFDLVQSRQVMHTNPVWEI